MGLFKTKPKTPDESYETPEVSDKKQKKRFGIFKGKGGKGTTTANDPDKPTSSPSNQTLKTFELTTETPKSKNRQAGDPCPIDENGFPIEEMDVDLPDDIPKSISAWAPNGVMSDLGLEEQRCDEDMTRDDQDIDADSLGSPISKFRKSQMMEANKTQNTIPLDPVDSTREPPGVDIHSPPSMRYLSYYITTLSTESSPDTSSEAPSRALRSLFSLSEHASSHKDRVAMVQWKTQNRQDDSSSVSLVPALLDFLKRCAKDTSEQYLAMLVLNNISIPHESKQCIALDYNGAKTLGRLLCQDPGCHLLVIILVNLTFCDAKVRIGLFANQDNIHLVEALTYALLLSSLSNDQLATLPPIPLADTDGMPHSPRKLLSILMTNLEELGLYSPNCYMPDVNVPPLSFDDSVFAETARWSLCALKNLTRPDKLAPSSTVGNDGYDVAARAVLGAGVVPLLLRIVRLNDDTGNFKQDPKEVGGGSLNTNNYPCWSLNSAQDAALHVLLHLTSIPGVRGTLRDEYGCANELSEIVKCGKSNKQLNALVMQSIGDEADTGDIAQLGLQSIKARIALSYLTETQYGQPTLTESSTVSIVANHEAILLTEILSNSLHSRPKEGPGGYSSSTFSLKGILYSIKCLMVERKNRLVFASTSGARLNVLLLKVIARYSFEDAGTATIVDREAAEHAVFCLYLMSNYGFHPSYSRTHTEQYNFLPAQLGDSGDTKQRIDARKTLVAVLSVYANMKNVTQVGYHAASQLMLRVKYLCYAGTVLELIDPENETEVKADYDLDPELLDKINAVFSERQSEGVPPSPDIFQRSIVRYQTSASSICVDSRTYPNGENFMSALQRLTGFTNRVMHLHKTAMAAAEEISFGSKTVDHSGSIDEIAIANNLVNAADGLTSRAYGFAWKWEDDEADIHPIVSHDDVSVTERSAPFGQRRRGLLGRLRFNSATDEDEPFSIFGFRCGAPMCGR